MTNSDQNSAIGRSGTAGCPHCGGKLKIRSSRAETLLSRELLLVCAGEDGCAAKFGGVLEITHQISASARPNEALQIRQAPPRRRAANDDHSPARDVSGPEVPPAANENAELVEVLG